MKLLLNEKFIGLLILINALVTIFLCFDNPPIYQVLVVLDYGITIIFLCEIVQKIFTYKKSFFQSSWNIFDFIIVTVSVVSLLLLAIGFSLEILSSFLIFRTFRLFKFFRILKIVPGLPKIYSDFKKAIRVTYGIMIGGFIILLIIGVTLCLIFKNFDPVNFGDPFVSIYTVFRLFSVEGWYEIPDAMCERTTYINATIIRIVFSLLVLFGTFVLGFIISSISDELALDNNDELMQKTKELESKIDVLNEKLDLLVSQKK